MIPVFLGTLLIITLASLADLSLIGYLKGNAVESQKISSLRYEIIQKQSRTLGLSNYVPVIDVSSARTWHFERICYKVSNGQLCGPL